MQSRLPDDVGLWSPDVACRDYASGKLPMIVLPALTNGVLMPYNSSCAQDLQTGVIVQRSQ